MSLLVVLALLLIVQGGLFAPKTLGGLGILPNGTQAGCATGMAKEYSCEENAISFLSCENGKFVEKTRDCGSSAKCTVGFFGVACVENITPYAPSSEAQENQTGTLPKSPKDKLGGFCGDGVCAVNESCASCVSDCTCAAKEFCDTRYGAICRPMDSCGDGLCSNNENKNKNCCQDCGCASGTICPVDEGTCVKPLNITQTSVNASLSKRFPSGFKIISSGDFSAGGKVFKEILVRDSSDVTWLVYVNSTAMVEVEAFIG